MVGYYDLVLVFIPGSLLGISALLHGSGWDLTLAVPSGALVATALIGHALFVRAPVGGGAQRTGAAPVPTPAAPLAD